MTAPTAGPTILPDKKRKQVAQEGLFSVESIANGWIEANPVLVGLVIAAAAVGTVLYLVRRR